MPSVQVGSGQMIMVDGIVNKDSVISVKHEYWNIIFVVGLFCPVFTRVDLYQSVPKIFATLFHISPLK